MTKFCEHSNPKQEKGQFLLKEDNNENAEQWASRLLKAVTMFSKRDCAQSVFLQKNVERQRLLNLRAVIFCCTFVISIMFIELCVRYYVIHVNIV